MSSFYGPAKARGPLGAAVSWYSDSELNCFPPPSGGEPGPASVAPATPSATRGAAAGGGGGDLLPHREPLVGSAASLGSSGVSIYSASTTATGARSSYRESSGSASGSSAPRTASSGGQPSFYGKGPKLNISGSSRGGTAAGRQGPRPAEYAPEVPPDDEVGQQAAPGETVSVLPKRPPRATTCRALDKEISGCTAVADVFNVALRDESSLDAANWANLVYALAHVKKHGTSPVLDGARLREDQRWQRSCGLLRPLLPQLTARDASNVLWSLATLDLKGEPLFMETADALCSGGKLSVCDPASVSKASWALTSVPNRDRRLEIFTHLAVPVVLRADTFPLGSLTMTAYSFAKAGHCDADVYEALSSALEHCADEDLRPIDVCNVVWAFCTVGYRDDALFVRLCEGHLCKPQVVAQFNPQDITNTAWGMSKVSFMHRQAMDSLALAGLQQRENFKPIHYTNLFYSFATLRMRGPEGFLSTMAESAVGKIRRFDCGNLAISVWALAQLRERHRLLDEAIQLIQLPEICSKVQSRTLSMFFLAFFRLGRVADADVVFHAAQNNGMQIGSSGFSAAVMTAEQGDDFAREVKIQLAMAQEAGDDRMFAAISNSAVIRLVKRQRFAEAWQLLRQMQAEGTERWTAVSSRLQARLAHVAAAPQAFTIEQESWVSPVKSGLHPIAATRQNEGAHAYTREFMTLQAVMCMAPQGDVDKCMAAVEEFAESRSLWLKITAWEKATVVHEVARLARPKLVLEIGAYVGYSAMNLARAVAPHGGRVVSLEVDPIHVTIVRNMVEYAGMSDHVDVWTGYCYDVIPHLLDTYGPKSFGMVFMDQKGTRFHTDLELLEELDLLADDAVVLADNVLKPGAPLYIHHLVNGPYTHTTAVSVREFMLQSEDWMVMGFHDASRGPAAPPPPLLHRLAFESDAFRKRSMFDSVAPSKGDWWAFSHRFVEGLDQCGVKPRIVGLHGRDNPIIKPEDVAGIFRHAGRLT